MRDEKNHPDQQDAAVPPSAPKGPGVTGGNDMDALLREWHRQNAARAAAGREALMARLRAEEQRAAGGALQLPPLIDAEMEASLRAKGGDGGQKQPTVTIRRFAMFRTWTAAAAAIILAAVLPLIMIDRGGGGGVTVAERGAGASSDGAGFKRASFDGYILCPEGGRLDAVDNEGNLLGPCELTHTDVVADVSGFLTRVTVTQKYHNPHKDKIEAVYTFPLSERSAVDRMTMTIGNRVIEGQVKERAEARRIYEAAKAEGRVASLLEQERPNIFTQSIANIDPGASVDITISYVETTKQVDGVFEFDFPTTIGPRFIPGAPITGDVHPSLPPEVRPRRGLVLLAPATVSEMRAGDTATRGALSEADLSKMLRAAIPVRGAAPSGNIWYSFRVAYQDGSAEFGTLYTDGLGTLNGRWFCVPSHALPGAGAAAGGGAGFAPDTNRVPDASKVTPMPVRPGTRAGHDISVTVNIDTGGPVLGMVKSELHELVTSKAGSRATVKLRNDSDIPNRDFVLKWRQESGEVEPAVFAYAGPQGNFFAVQMTPPPPPPPIGADDAGPGGVAAVAREMIFVLDVSGSMSGRPIEKAKEVLDKALSSLRPRDTFNIIKFQNTLDQLWSGARRATPENLAEAREYYNRQIGGGGTHMVQAIQAAYRAGGAERLEAIKRGITPMQLANQPADGRRVVVDVARRFLWQLHAGGVESWRLRCAEGVEVDVRPVAPIPASTDGRGGVELRLAGRWETVDGRRVLVVEGVSIIDAPTPPVADASRFIVFLTDGLIGNDNEVIAEIQANRSKAAIFPMAIGNAPNRYLLDSMARFGRGEVEYVYDSTNADEVIARFAKRIETPVLTNIAVEFSPNLNVLDVMTALGGGGGAVASMDAIPDLFDVKPLTIVGRYNQPASGTVTITGTTAAGPYRRVVNVDLPAASPAADFARWREIDLGLMEGAELPEAARRARRHDTVATLWARAKVESVLAQDLRGVLAGNVNPMVRSEVVSLGESFSLLTQYTSFVAVDRLRVTVAGKPRLVHIPIELTAGTEFKGFFGGPDGRPASDDEDRALLGLSEGMMGYWYQPDGGAAGAYAYAAVQPGSMPRGLGLARLMDAAEEEQTAPPQADAAMVLSTEGAKVEAPATAPAGAPSKEAEAPGRGGLRRHVPVGPSGGRESRGVDAKKTEPDPAAVVPAASPTVQAPPPPPPSPLAPAEPAPTGGSGTAGKPAAPAPARGDFRLKNVQPEAAEKHVRMIMPTRGEADHDRWGRDEAFMSLVLPQQMPGDAVLFGVVRPVGTLEKLYEVRAADPTEAQQVAPLLTLFFEDTAGAAPGTSHKQPGAATPGRQRVVLAEHVVIRVGALVKEGKMEPAAALATALGDALPTVQAAAELKRVFTDAAVTAEERTRVLDEQVKGANERLASILRDAKLRERLEERLVPAAQSGTLADPTGLLTVGDGVVVTVLVEDAGEATRQALATAGLKVETYDEAARVVIGVCPLAKLADVTLAEGVRRVEATKEQ